MRKANPQRKELLSSSKAHNPRKLSLHAKSIREKNNNNGKEREEYMYGRKGS